VPINMTTTPGIKDIHSLSFEIIDTFQRNNLNLGIGVGVIGTLNEFFVIFPDRRELIDCRGKGESQGDTSPYRKLYQQSR